MSAIGEYIHRTWRGYLAYGNERPKSDFGFKDTTQQKVNIFNRIMEKRRNALQNSSTYDAQKLKQLSKKYNDECCGLYEAMASLNQDELTIFLQKVIQNAEGIAKNITAKDLIKYVKIDPKTGKFVLKNPAANALKVLKIKSINFTVKGSFVQMSSILKAVQQVLNVIETINDNINSSKFNDEQKTFLKTVRRDLIKLLNTTQLNLKTGSKKLTEIFNIGYDKSSKNFTEPQEARGRVDKKSAEAFYGALRGILLIADSVQKLSALNGSLEAILSVMVPYLHAMAEGNIKFELTKALSAWLDRKLVGRKSGGVQQSLKIVPLHDNTRKAMLEQQKEQSVAMKRAQEQGEKYEKEIKDLPTTKMFDANGQFDFANDNAQGKVDAIVSFSLDDIALKDANVSVKGYNLDSKDYAPGVPAYVDIHSGTSLLAFLGAFGENTANHFLNVFATHPDNEAYASSYGAVRKAANDAFVISLLYSGLSGRGLNRKEGFADILLIADTSNAKRTPLKNGANYVYRQFISFKQILESLNDSEGIKRLVINDKVGNAAVVDLKLPNDSAESAEARITQLLSVARAKRLKIGITSATIKKIMYNKSAT